MKGESRGLGEFVLLAWVVVIGPDLFAGTVRIVPEVRAAAAGLSIVLAVLSG